MIKKIKINALLVFSSEFFLFAHLTFAANEQTNYISQMPQDIVNYIISKTDDQSLATLPKVNHTFNSLINKNFKKKIATALFQNKVRKAQNLGEYKSSQTIQATTSFDNPFDFSPFSNHFAYINDGQLIVINLGTLNQTSDKNQAAHQDITSHVNLNPLDDKDDVIFKETIQINNQPDSSFFIKFLPCGKLLAIGDSRHKTLQIWNIEKKELTQDFKNFSFFRQFTFSPDGKSVVTGSTEDSLIHITHLTTQEHHTLAGHKNSVFSLDFSPNGNFLISGSDDHSIKIWDFKSSILLKTFEHNDTVSSVAFSKDGKFFASGSRDNTIKIWNIDTIELHKELKGHVSWVQSVAFSPNNSNILISASEDDSIKIWDIELGIEALTFKQTNATKFSLAQISQTGEFLAFKNYSKNIFIQKLDLSKLMN